MGKRKEENERRKKYLWKELQLRIGTDSVKTMAEKLDELKRTGKITGNLPSINWHCTKSMEFMEKEYFERQQIIEIMAVELYGFRKNTLNTLNKLYTWN